MAKKQELYFDKLDNTANLFPVIVSESVSNVYRISATLKEEIDCEKLQMAVDKVLPYFSVFGAKLRKGMFWYYFESNHKKPPVVHEEKTYPCAYINPLSNNDYLFRVSYYKNRINLEVFHVITDGTGALAFLKEIVFQYLRYAHRELKEKVSDSLQAGVSLSKEDSYIKNYKQSYGKLYKTEKAVIIKGERFPATKMGVLHGYIPVSEIKAVAKKYGLTINQYLIGTYIWSVYKKELGMAKSNKPISVCVPVNLRPYYDSQTLKNFFAVVSAVFKPTKDQYTFEEVIKEVADSLKKQITEENLEKLLSYNVSNEKNKIIRAVPLFMKNLALKAVYTKSARANTSTITNLGQVSVPEAYKKYINNFHAILSLSKGQNLKATVVSYDDTMVFTFSSAVVKTDIQKEFFKRLVQDGINVEIESNGVYYEQM